MTTLLQMIKVLGFHDLTSFFLTSAFVIAALAFIISCAIFLVKKRRERLNELNKIVREVQEKALLEKESQKLSLKPEPHKEPEAVPLKRVDTKVPKAISTPVEPIKKAPVVSSVPDVKITLQKPSAEKSVVKTLEKTPPVAHELEEPVVDAKPLEKSSLGAALKNTRGGFIEKLSKIFSRKKEISDEDFEEIEAILFTADIGVKTAQKLLDVLKDRVQQEKNSDRAFLQSVLKEEMCRILESVKPIEKTDGALPQVLMFVGVNGAGKTTSIGKLGAQLKSAGKKVLFGAGDTFRAAATLQLSLWGEKIGADVVSGKENADSASVLFEAIEKAKANNVDYVLCDTAGRLHTKLSLMDELKKVHRVMSKAQNGAPHEVYLVIDATMGQNAINQAREFAEVTPLTGVVLSKLDGTAKGGVALGIVDELKVPIRYIGIGEQSTDLKDFNAKLFVDALFEDVEARN